MNASSLVLRVLAGAVLAPPALAQTNDLPLSKGADVFYLYGDPSVGSSPGAWGDLFWRVYPGDRVLAHQHGAAGARTVEIDGFVEYLFDTEWSTTPDFYDRILGPALSSATVPCALEPDFLQLGATSGILLVLGSSGLPSPCALEPELCCGGPCICDVPAAAGWRIEIALGGAIAVPADGTAASDLAVSYLLPAGMSTSGGPCGTGDYVLQDAHSTDETQHDDCGGISAFGGAHVPGHGPFPDAWHEVSAAAIAVRQPFLNVVADGGGGFGVEVGSNGGGALNGLKLDTASGAASLGLEVRDREGVGDLAFAAWSFTPIGPPGVPLLGGHALVLLQHVPPACFHGAVSANPGLTQGEGSFVSCQQPLPVVGPLDVYTQGLILDPASATARTTNRVRTTLY